MAASAKHRLGFREKLGLYALALLLIGAALLGYLWFALDRYESNTPESSVRRYLQETCEKEATNSALLIGCESEDTT